MNINCLIIDDEPLAINVIKSYIEEIDTITILNTFSNAIDALTYLKEHSVDLIFLDINMPLLNGLDFIKNLETKPLIIVTTAYDEYAIKTYELEVLDYLIKPIPFPRFMKAVNRALKSSSNNKPIEPSESIKRPFTFIKVDKKKMQKIYLDEILLTGLDKIVNEDKSCVSCRSNTGSSKNMPLLEENLLSDSMIALSISLSSVLSVKKYGRFEPESISIKNNNTGLE